MTKKKIEREEYIRKVALNTIVTKMNDDDVDFILENVSTQKIEKHLRKMKIKNIENEINDGK